MQIDGTRWGVGVVGVVDEVLSLPIVKEKDRLVRHERTRVPRRKWGTDLLINLVLSPLMALSLLTQLVSGSSVATSVGLLGLLEAAGTRGKRAKVNFDLHPPTRYIDEKRDTGLTPSSGPPPSLPDPACQRTSRWTDSLGWRPGLLRGRDPPPGHSYLLTACMAAGAAEVDVVEEGKTA